MSTSTAPQDLPEQVNKRQKTDLDAAGKQEVNASEARPVSTPTALFALNPNFITFLIRAKAEHLHANQENKIFVATREMKVIDVFKGLIERHMLAVPVVSGKGNKTKYYGFLDLADIVKYIVTHFGEEEMKKYHQNFWQIIEKEDAFKEKTVRNIMTYPLSNRNPFHPIKQGYSLFTAVEALAREKNLRRVPVIDAEDKLVGVITQSMVVSFLNTHMEALGDLRKKPVSQMVESDKLSVTINQSETAFRAFSVMTSLGVSGLPVVDDKEKLVSTISLSDLKVVGVDASFFYRLTQPIRDFLFKEGANRPLQPIFVTMNDTFETVVRLCMQNGVHRVHVVDDPSSMVPLCVISLRDLLLQVVNGL